MKRVPTIAGVLLWGLFSVLLSPGLWGAEQSSLDLEQVKLTLGGPVTLSANGQRYTGAVLRVNPEELVLLQRDFGGGEVELLFLRSEVKALQLPGAELEAEVRAAMEAGRHEDGLALMTALLEQRQPFLPYFTQEQLLGTVDLVQHAAYAGNHLATLRAVRMVEPHLTQVPTKERLADTELLALYRFGLGSETEAKARAWIDNRSGRMDSALGWYVLARQQLDEDEPLLALETALEPIVRATQLRVEWLPEVYAVAIEAANAAGRVDHARLLEEEREKLATYE